MKNIPKILFTIILFQARLNGQDISQNQRDALSFSASYIGDMVNIVTGGLKTGSVYLGIFNLGISFETEKAGWWNGGLFFINAANTHGATPSNSFIGDFQIVSNIEAGSHTFMQELWFKQRLGALYFIFGVQDVNAEFAGCSSTALFLNSSFGISPTISNNIPLSVFPLTSPGFTVVWSSSDHMIWRAAIFDGSPATFEQNPYNITWNFRNSDGIINLMEAEYLLKDNTNVKIGIYHHDHLYASSAIEKELVYEHNIGIYSIGDVQVLQDKNSGSTLNIFGQLGFSSRMINENYWYGGCGVKYTGVFTNSKKDEIGIAVAHAGMRTSTDETAIELTYRRLINEHLFLQPDIQYIINPARQETELQNCLVGSIRFGISL